VHQQRSTRTAQDNTGSDAKENEHKDEEPGDKKAIRNHPGHFPLKRDDLKRKPSCLPNAVMNAPTEEGHHKRAEWEVAGLQEGRN